MTVVVFLFALRFELYKLIYIYIYRSHGCDIKKELKVYILQDNVIGSCVKKEFYEDWWITKLNTKSPHGENTNLKHFAETYYELFD